jgi:hypothetical protein
VLQLAHSKDLPRYVGLLEVQQTPERRQAQRSTCFQTGQPQYGEVAEPLAKGAVVGECTHAQVTGIAREYISARPKGGPMRLGTWALHCDLQTRGMQIAMGEPLLHRSLHHQVSMDAERIGDSQLASDLVRRAEPCAAALG